MVTLFIPETQFAEFAAYLDWSVAYLIKIKRSTNSLLLRARSHTTLQFKVCYNQFDTLFDDVLRLDNFLHDCEVVFDD